MRVCFIGDSFVNGTGDPDYQGWPGRLCAAARAQGHDVTCYNLGIRGATSADMRAWWKVEAERRLTSIPDAAVVFSFGTNDAKAAEGGPRVAASQTPKNTRTVLMEARAQWPVLFVAPPRTADTAMNADIESRLKAIGETCAELGIPYLDSFAASVNFKHWLTEAAAGDGIHPGGKGYAELAELVAAWSPWQSLLDRLRS